MITLNIPQYEATIEKVAKINERAAKRGLAGRLQIVVDTEKGFRERRVCRHDASVLCELADIFGGIGHYFEQVVDIEIGGTAPKHNGWTFAARVDRVGESFTLATAPGIDHVNREGIVLGHCDHCNTNRLRNTTYIVVNEQGTQVQVGSTCIKDFLGWEGHIAWLDAPTEIDDEWLGGSYHAEPEYKVADVLRLAIASVRDRGFVSTQVYGERSTRDHVSLVWAHRLPTKDAEERKRLIALATEVSDEDVESLLSFLRSDEFNGTGTYVENLKVIANSVNITNRQMGLLVSAPQAYAKHLGQVAQREAKKASEWIGQKGEKITTTGKVEKVTNCGSYSYSGPDSYLYIWRTEAGEIVKTFTTSSTFADVEVGDTITVLATVKDHEVYGEQNTKQTLVTRSKKIG